GAQPPAQRERQRARAPGGPAGRHGAEPPLRMSADRYDAIVLGDGLGALVATATLATGKARVLWVPHERQTWSFPAGGHRFPVEDGPFIGMGMDAVFPALADATGVHLSEAA